jgi:hypothetical protein
MAYALHWASYNNFAEHLLYERVADGLLASLDDIAEVCIIPHLKVKAGIANMLLPAEVYENASKKDLAVAISNGIKLVEELKYAKGITFQYFFGTQRSLQLLQRL